MLKTKRLELVEFNLKYAAELYELWSDFEVIKYTYMPLMKSVDECSDMISIQIGRTNKDFTDRFIILSGEKAIGIAGCAVMNEITSDSVRKPAFGLYYQLSKRYWGNGYASECAKAIVGYVFEHYPNAVIKADAVSVNAASLAVLRKIGFKETGVIQNGFTRNGFMLDLIDFELTNMN